MPRLNSCKHLKMMDLRRGLLRHIILLFLPLLAYVDTQEFCPQQCPTWPHLCGMVRKGNSPTTSRQCISAEEARMLQQATQGMGGIGTSIGTSGGIPQSPGRTFSQPGMGPSAASPGSPAFTDIFPGIDSGTSRGGLSPGGMTGFSPGSSFPGASSGFDPSQLAFSPGLTPRGGQPFGSSGTGLMGARPLHEPPGGAPSLPTFPESPPVPGGSAGDRPIPVGEASPIASDSRGTYYNFFAYSGSDPIRVTITKTGFCQPRGRPSPTDQCYQNCDSDDNCAGSQKCCPVGCSLECGQPRLDVPAA